MQNAKMIKYLSSGVRQAKHLFLAKVSMDGEYYNVEDGWDPAEELLYA